MFKTGKIVEQFCLWVCLFMLSYQFIVFVWGRQGLFARRKLLQVQNTLEVHYETLKRHQHDLLAITEQIYNDSGYIALEARNLGYYRKNDKLILLNSWFQAHPAPSPGDRIPPELLEPEARIWGVWLYAGFLAGFCWFVIRLFYFGQLLPPNNNHIGRQVPTPKYRRAMDMAKNTRKTTNAR